MKPDHIHCSNCNSPARLINDAFACQCAMVPKRNYATSKLPESWHISVEALSPRQYEVIVLLSKGYSVKGVALHLGTHYTTIKRHLYAARQKLNARSTWHLVSIVAIYDHELKKASPP